MAKKKLDLSEDLSKALAGVLINYADTHTMYEIRINGKCVSFHGVRLFKTIGAAKSTITRSVDHVISNGAYRRQYAKTDELKTMYDIVIKELPMKWNDKEIPKAVTAFLVDKGIITITEV